ncbi:MAG: dTDP-glucose 4,6-dehydratase [Patescibacteria group bacterium]
MKILVTGGAGFIGSNFVRHICGKYPDYKVVVLDKLTYAGHLENLKGQDLQFIKGDICDPEVVNRAMEGVDVIVHFAAETHVDRSVMGPEVFIQTNVIGTQVLLQHALKHEVKLFHHVSTDEVFGALPLDRPDLKFTETTCYAPHSPYSAAKAASDHLVRAWHDTYGLPVTITNTSNNYGPYHDPEKLTPRFITNLLDGQKVPLMGKGENIRDWCYVLDHCRAIDLIIHAALKDPKIIGETFCVGGNSERTNLEVTKAILKLLGKDETWIEPIPHRLGHDARYAIDSSKIKKMLGWEPEATFEESLAETVKWFRENEWWWRPLKEGRPLIDPEVQRKLLRSKEK